MLDSKNSKDFGPDALQELLFQYFDACTPNEQTIINPQKESADNNKNINKEFINTIDLINYSNETELERQ